MTDAGKLERVMAAIEEVMYGMRGVEQATLEGMAQAAIDAMKAIEAEEFAAEAEETRAQTCFRFEDEREINVSK
jgi:hypothetical protein